MENDIRFIVEKSGSQKPRHPKVAKDGTLEVYVSMRHRNVFMYVAGNILERRYTPTFAEIAGACGYVGADSALRAVRSLAERGLLTTNVQQARSINVTARGEEVYRQWKKGAKK